MLMQWVYSKNFSGGGVILSLLVVGEGLHVIHAILGTALAAAGEARKAAVVTLVSLLPALGMLILLVQNFDAAGAALSNALTILMSSVFLGILVWRRFNALMEKRSVRNISLAGCLMVAVFMLLSGFELFFLLPVAGGLAAYFVALIASHEITRRDFTAMVPWSKLSASPGNQPLIK
jgi:O-antigen/teichoic acid export membrane protein